MVKKTVPVRACDLGRNFVLFAGTPNEPMFVPPRIGVANAFRLPPSASI